MTTMSALLWLNTQTIFVYRILYNSVISTILIRKRCLRFCQEATPRLNHCRSYCNNCQFQKKSVNSYKWICRTGWNIWSGGRRFIIYNAKSVLKSLIFAGTVFLEVAENLTAKILSFAFFSACVVKSNSSSAILLRKRVNAVGISSLLLRLNRKATFCTRDGASTMTCNQSFFQ